MNPTRKGSKESHFKDHISDILEIHLSLIL